jgi:hypothetical protein
MSPRATEPEPIDPDDDAAAAEKARADGSTELDQREAFSLLFNDPAVRNYTIAALAALAMIFLSLMQQASDLGGLFIVIIGVVGIMVRWLSAAVFVVLLVPYFMILPTGIPGEGYWKSWEIEEGHFRPGDIILVLSVLVYVACHYRIYGLTTQAVAFEGVARRKDEPVTRRPPALVAPAELGTLIAVAVAAVVAGQLVWWLVNEVEVDTTEDFPFVWAESGWSRGKDDRPIGPASLPPNLTRFMLLVGLAVLAGLIGRLVFGYWRLRTMGPAEGAMILLDGGWDETRRERSRQEKWRIWGRKRAEAQAAEEARAAEKAKGKR